MPGASVRRHFKITKELEAKCNAPNQFERFDNRFKAVILTPPPAPIRKKSARGKKRNIKHKGLIFIRLLSQLLLPKIECLGHVFP
jgi:hypothetical protein